MASCVNSIINQDFIDFELLLVDDGSTDGSGELCNKLAATENRISVFHKENGGNSSARNLGIENAKGEWLYFVDSDDELFPYSLSVLSNCITEGIDMVLAGYVVMDNSAKEIYSVNQRSIDLVSNEKAIELMYRSFPYRYLGYIWIKLFRASIIKNHSLLFANDICFNEDRLFTIQFLCKSQKSVVYTTTPVYKYFERPKGLMSSIKRDFNPMFITDIEASKRMVLSIKETYPNSVIIYNLSKFGLYHSFVAITSRMNRNGFSDLNIRKMIKDILFSEVTYFEFIRFEIKRYLLKIRNKINSFFHETTVHNHTCL